MIEPFEKISVLVDGRHYYGRYSVKDRLLTVTADGLGSKSSFVNAYNKPYVIAEMLLRELVKDKSTR